MKFSRETMRAWALDNFDVREVPDSDELAIRVCPYCDDGDDGSRHREFRHRLNIASGLYYCFRNHCAANFVQLACRVGGHDTLVELREALEPYKAGVISPTTERPTFAALRAAAERILKAKPRFQKTSGAPEGYCTDWTLGPAEFSYAVDRGIPPEHMTGGDVGFCTRGPFVRRIVFLVREQLRVRFWMGRTILGYGRPRYLYPTLEETGGIGRSHVVWGLDAVRSERSIVVCEGVLSAMSAGPNAVAILGSTISEVQAAKLAQKRPKRVLLLVELGVSAQVATANAMRLVAKGLTVETCDLISGDPNDNPWQMEEVLRSGVEARPLDALRSRLT